MPKKSDVEAVKAELRAKSKGKTPPELFLSSGEPLVDLAVSGKLSGGFAAGCYYLLVGGSRSGKTFLVLQTLAQASINPKFDDYKLVLFEPERGARMNVRRFFGRKLDSRLIREQPKSLDEFYFRADDYAKNGPCIMGLDSMDALQPLKDGEFFDKQKAIYFGRRKVKEDEKGKGSYGTQKAKDNSSKLRELHNRLEDHKSILLVISQTRRNIGWDSTYNPETRSGGEALTFYATSELWFKVREPIKRTINKKPRKIGTVLQVKVKKNRDTGREWNVELIHYPSIGFDTTGSLVAWLIEEGAWKESDKGIVTAGDLGITGKREQVIQEIEEQGKERDLRLAVVGVWRSIEEASRVVRKSRYGE